MKTCPITDKTTCPSSCKFLLYGGCSLLLSTHQVVEVNQKIDKLTREVRNLQSQLQSIRVR